MRTTITRVAGAIAATATMLLGAAGAATAQPAMPAGLADIADIANRAATALPGQRTQIGEILSQGGVYTATMYKQVMGSQNVTQGEKITVRVEVDGGKSGLLSEARVQALTDVMPAGFQIDSIVVNHGEKTTPLTAEQYSTVERGELRDTRVDFTTNGIGRIHIGEGSMSVDFTYIAPDTTGWNQTGAGMEVSAANGTFARSTKVDEGGPSVNVIARPIVDIPGLPGGDNNSSSSIDWGSLKPGGAGSSK